MNLSCIYSRDKEENLEIKADLYIGINKKKKKLTIVNGIFIYKYIPNGVKDKINCIINKNIKSDEHFNINDNVSIILVLYNNKFYFTDQDKKAISGKINILNLKPHEDFYNDIISLIPKKRVKKIDPRKIPKFTLALHPFNEHSCIEIIEGDSAQSSLIKGIELIPNKLVNKYSFLSVKGKISNVSKNKDCVIYWNY